jgi:hypothetical protein
MPTDRIEFISSYCDHWCERCRFTERCSAFACHSAIAMCDGDVRAAFELAIGRPQPVAAAPSTIIGEPLTDQWEEPDTEELAAISRDEKAREARIDAHPIAQKAWAYMEAVHDWLERSTPALANADPIVREALEVVTWDSTFIVPKLARALEGHERELAGQYFGDDPVQCDANGSAKVALLSLERSEASWMIIGEATGDAGVVRFAQHAARLRGDVEREFPRAMEFVRPGFDEPWR